jgi:hypothetical protein
MLGRETHMHTLTKEKMLAAALLALAFVLAGDVEAAAQETASAAPKAVKNGVSHEVQFYLLAASNTSGGRRALPRELDGVVKQLRASLPYSNYESAATLLYRVKDGGPLEVGIKGPSVGGADFTNSPTTYRFQLNGVRLVEDAAGQRFIHVPRFAFSLRYPVQTGTARGDNNSPSAPIIQYEDAGITTELSVREGEPTVVGTVSTSRPDQAFYLVITVRRAAGR